MIWFWLLAVVFVAVALLFVLPPLMRSGRASSLTRDAVNVTVYRDQIAELEADLAAGSLSRERYEEAHGEIERRLLEETGREPGEVQTAPRRSLLPALVSGIAVPVVAVGVYLAVGNLDGLSPEKVAVASAPHSIDPKQIEEMVEQLAARLQADPGNVEGWVMLARSYQMLGRFKQAASAYQNAVQREPGSAQLLADYADALAMAQGRTLDGEPEKLIARALAIDPNNVKALALAGTVAFNKKDYKGALAHWEKLAAILPPDSEMARAVQGSIVEARSLGGIAAPQPKVAAAPKPAPAASGKGGSISGVVELAPALAAKAAPGDTVFIFARAAEGPRMPLAILRKQVSELPATFTLNDSMAMTAGMSISSFEKIVVSARVSKAGTATAQSGDLEGASAPVKVGTKDVAVVIEKVIP